MLPANTHVKHLLPAGFDIRVRLPVLKTSADIVQFYDAKHNQLSEHSMILVARLLLNALSSTSGSVPASGAEMKVLISVVGLAECLRWQAGAATEPNGHSTT